VPYRTLWVPLNVQVPFSCAHSVQVEVVVVGVVVVVVVVVVLPYQQLFHCPTAGSPKVALLQAAGPVRARVTYAVEVPYLTLRVPLKLHVPFSCAHKVQADEDELFFARASAVGSSVLATALASLVLADATSAVVASLAPPLPPPQAANTAADRTDRPTDRNREEY